MVGVARGVNPGQPFSAANELEERFASRRGRGRIVRIVEELAGRARQKDRVVLLQVLLGDVGRVIRDRRGPRAGLLAHLLDRARGQRNRRVDISGRPREHQHLA